MEPTNPVFPVLATARERSRTHEDAQAERVARALQRDKDEVVRGLEHLLRSLAVRVTRSLAVARYLLDELNAGQVPTIRSVFETRRQNHSADPERVAEVMRSRENWEPAAFGPEAGALGSQRKSARRPQGRIASTALCSASASG